MVGDDTPLARRRVAQRVRAVRPRRLTEKLRRNDTAFVRRRPKRFGCRTGREEMSIRILCRCWNDASFGGMIERTGRGLS